MLEDGVRIVQLSFIAYAIRGALEVIVGVQMVNVRLFLVIY